MNGIVCGDCLEVMKTFLGESVDLIVTDPPYGYSFMGKDWDKAVPSVDVWKECLRVLKSGAFAFVMSAPRQDVLSQMIVRLGSAGFETGFTSIYWAYASGFPKAENIGKAIDKRNGRQSVDFEKLGLYLKEKRMTLGYTTIQLGELFKTSDDRINHGGCVTNWEQGLNVPTESQWKILKEKLKLDDSFDWLISREEAERQVVGKKPWSSPIKFFGITEKSKRVVLDVTVPTLEQAKVLDGCYGGFQPKPAVEVVIVCMKPLGEKTFVDQALANGKGVTWLDNARIPFKPYSYPKGCGGAHGSGEIYGTAKDDMRKEPYISKEGRFPANLLVSDDILNDGKITIAQPHPHEHKNLTQIYGGGKGLGQESASGISEYDDSGSFSRYFDLDSWWNKTVENLPEAVRKTFPFLICPKASKSERNKGCESLPEQNVRKEDGSWGSLEVFSNTYTEQSGNPSNRGTTPKHRNIHPCVKPLKLMSYLVTLGSKPKDVVLDPFAGSGTVCMASKLLNRNFIGIEINPEYCEIAKKRVDEIPNQTRLLEVKE